MANRHSNKKLRSAVKARMAQTGESYQCALSRIHAAAEHGDAKLSRVDANPYGIDADLIETRLFGHPAIVTVVSSNLGPQRATAVHVSVLPRSGAISRASFPTRVVIAGFGALPRRFK